MNNRWKMKRIGFVNFWLYDEEDFEFEDGKLLLRGQNGSGKSITTQSFIPFVLDGDRTPSRLDPFGSSDRRMEYYFLGEEGRDEATGYLFLEFKKEDTEEYAKEQGAEVISLCVKIEEELASLDEDEEKEMLEALGLEESGLDKVIKASYDLLGLMSFLTAGEPEVRAWTIKKGTKAPQAAGKIHSDIERGFIRAEIVSYDDLIREGSINAVKERGLMRSEGRICYARWRCCFI